MVRARAGLEIHQQLDTHKLFCPCESRLSDEVVAEFTRVLRPTQSEMGEVDKAALEESVKKRRFLYQATDNSCLVEADEEPPHELNRDALMIALKVAALLNARPVDEVQFMRKIVIDGSNTTGFQRTALIAVNGCIETSFGKVDIPTICLEEEAARKVEDRGDVVVYRLDRLGIPLVEIATSPDIHSGEELREVAERIGYLLRATKRVRRGQGTIRQDVNISIEGGARVEIKGASKLPLLPRIFQEEVNRQVALLEIRDLLRERNATVGEAMDVTDIFQNTASRVIKTALKSGGVVLAAPLRGFRGVLKSGKYRLGRELAERAKAVGLKGIFHGDEMPAYGVSEEEVEHLREKLGLGPDDSFVLLAAPPERAWTAMERVLERARVAVEGVPEETRGPREDGTTFYMRPLPGGARMYPETDVPPVKITREMWEEVLRDLPPLPEEMAAHLVERYGISEQQAWQLIRDGTEDVFEDIASRTAYPGVVARVLLNLLPEMERDGLDVGRVTPEVLMEVFSRLDKGEFAKEGVEEILRAVASGKSPEEAISALRGGGEEELRDFIRRALEERRDFVVERGERAFSAIMGVVMKEFRGRVDGKVISEMVRDELRKFLEEG